jgi:hypothetical protein
VGTRPLGRYRHRGEIILNWIFKKWDGDAMNWIDLTQDIDRWRALLCGNEISGSIKCGNFLTTWWSVSFLGRTMLHGVSYMKKSGQPLECESDALLPNEISIWLKPNTLQNFLELQTAAMESLSSIAIRLSEKMRIVFGNTE